MIRWVERDIRKRKKDGEEDEVMMERLIADEMMTERLIEIHWARRRVKSKAIYSNERVCLQDQEIIRRGRRSFRIKLWPRNIVLLSSSASVIKAMIALMITCNQNSIILTILIINIVKCGFCVPTYTLRVSDTLVLTPLLLFQSKLWGEGSVERRQRRVNWGMWSHFHASRQLYHYSGTERKRIVEVRCRLC